MCLTFHLFLGAKIETSQGPAQSVIGIGAVYAGRRRLSTMLHLLPAIVALSGVPRQEMHEQTCQARIADLEKANAELKELVHSLRGQLAAKESRRLSEETTASSILKVESDGSIVVGGGGIINVGAGAGKESASAAPLPLCVTPPTPPPPPMTPPSPPPEPTYRLVGNGICAAASGLRFAQYPIRDTGETRKCDEAAYLGISIASRTCCFEADSGRTTDVAQPHALCYGFCNQRTDCLGMYFVEGECILLFPSTATGVAPDGIDFGTSGCNFVDGKTPGYSEDGTGPITQLSTLRGDIECYAKE